MKINEEYKNYTVLDSFFAEKVLKNRTKFNGYSLVKFQNGEYGVVNTRLYVKPGLKELIADKSVDIYEKGKEKDIRKTYTFLRERNLGLALNKKNNFREVKLEPNQEIIARVENIKLGKNGGFSELIVDTNKTKLSFGIKNQHAQRIKIGQKISIIGTEQGHKINLIRQTLKHSLKR